MSTNMALVEAVQHLNKSEEEYRKAREEVANLLKKAAETQQVTNLSRLTGINRTTIYWLINTWSTLNENGSSRSRSA